MCVLATMTALTLIFLGTSGSSGGTLVFQYDTLRRRVREVVPSGDRRDRVLAKLDEMEDEIKTHVESVIDSFERVGEEMQDYNADLDQIEREGIVPLDRRRNEIMIGMLDDREELREMLLEDEWNEVFAPGA